MSLDRGRGGQIRASGRKVGTMESYTDHSCNQTPTTETAAAARRLDTFPPRVRALLHAAGARADSFARVGWRLPELRNAVTRLAGNERLAALALHELDRRVGAVGLGAA